MLSPGGAGGAADRARIPVWGWVVLSLGLVAAGMVGFMGWKWCRTRRAQAVLNPDVGGEDGGYQLMAA
jgi:hypothetical protein